MCFSYVLKLCSMCADVLFGMHRLASVVFLQVWCAEAAASLQMT